jgi:hypothetical protein
MKIGHYVFETLLHVRDARGMQFTDVAPKVVHTACAADYMYWASAYGTTLHACYSIDYFMAK